MTAVYPEFFKRIDETSDTLFYSQPRLVPHIDEAAQQAALELYDVVLERGGRVLDLMSSYHSHLPDKFSGVTGLGLNQEELNENPLLSERVVHDLNAVAVLPFDTDSFDGVVCSVSVQYMTHPTETFAEIARVLKPGCPFIVTFSNRMFPTKAVLVWRASDDAAHVRLVETYFEKVSLFGPTTTQHYVPEAGDPLYSVRAYKRSLDDN